MKVEGHPYEVIICGQDRNQIAETGGGYTPLAHGEQYYTSPRNDLRF